MVVRNSLLGLNRGIGPAHAVYFATYEAVKQAMGGNKGTEHHPLAAGTFRRCGRKLIWRCADAVAATSGACATIASDALMNPFDGEKLFSLPLMNSNW